MTDPDFYRRERPRNARLPEDRPRGGTPGARPGSSFAAFWVGVVLIAALILVVMVGLLG
jgi:hypothetical protein